MASSSSLLMSRLPPSIPLLCDRFKDFPETMRKPIIDATISIIKGNITEIANCNWMHGLGWGGGVGPRCRACIVELARAVKAAEGAGVEVEEEYKSLLVDLEAQEEMSNGEIDRDKGQTTCEWRRKRQREKEVMEDKEREFKRYCRDSMLAYMTSFDEEEEDGDEEDDDNDDELEEVVVEDDDDEILDDEIVEIYD